jgi:tetratricopeptide (TPR) repeat protein
MHRQIRIFFALASMLFCLSIYAKNATPEADITGAIALFNENKYTEARDLFNAYIKENKDDAEAWYYLGRIAHIENRIDDAEDYLKKAIGIDGSQSPYHQWLGRVYALQAVNASVFRQPFIARNVRRSFERAVKLDPDNVDARYDLLQFFIFAPGIVGGSTDKALEQAAEIKKRDAVRGHGAYGFIYGRQDEFEKAEREFTTAIEIDPAQPEPYMWLAFMYARAEKYGQAMSELQTVIERRPDYMPPYYHYGRVAALSGEQLEQGKQYLEKYMEYSPAWNEPTIASAHYRLGNIYEKADDPERAREQYEITLKKNPDHQQAKEALKNIR